MKFNQLAEKKNRSNKVSTDTKIEKTEVANTIETPSTPISKREHEGSVSGKTLKKLDVSLIDLSPYQPRIMTQNVITELKTLAGDIEKNGLANPIIVRQKGPRYEVIAGERRLRAVRDILKLETISVYLYNSLNDEKAALLALSDNTVRENLSDFENILRIKKNCEMFSYPFDNYEFVVSKFSLDQSKYFRLRNILDLPSYMLESLEVEPQLISGYIAQTVKTEVNKALELMPEDIVHKLLKESWSKYVENFESTRKRSSEFLKVLQHDDGKEEKSNLETNKNVQPRAPRSFENSKVDFKTETGVKFGSMRTTIGTQGKKILNLRVSLDAEIDEEKANRIQAFFQELNK